MLIKKDTNSGREFRISGRLSRTNWAKKKTFLSQHRELFESMKPQIEMTLEVTGYFHGTGAKHYKNGDKHYYKRDGPMVVEDSLHSFLTKGISPMLDPWINYFYGNVSSKTISITKIQMYARVFASFFLEKGQRFEYEFGSRFFWIQSILLRTLPKNLMNIHRLNKKKLSLIKKQIKTLMKWIPVIGSDKKVSDIKGNFPVIFGINETIEVVQPLIVGSGIYECRTLKTIRPEKFTHIQVPLRYLQIAASRVNETDLNLPVIPIEFAELIASEKPITEHLNQSPLEN